MHRLPRAFRLRQQHLLAPRALNRLPHYTRITSPAAYRLATGEPTRFQVVRFKKRGLSMRRLAVVGLYIGTTVAILNTSLRYLGVSVEIEMDDEVHNHEHAHIVEGEEESEYADEESLFIPMTWATALPRTFYKASDPEWQEFIKFSKDKPRAKRIQDELVNVVLNETQKQPRAKTMLGPDVKVGHYFLDLTYPDAPPQEFERSGLEIGDGFIAWSKQRLDATQHFRLTRALWPQAAFESIWATTKVMAGIQYRRVKETLGFEVKDPLSQHRQAIEMMVQQQQEAEGRKQGAKSQTEPGANPGAVVGSPGPSAGPQSARTQAEDGKKQPWYQPWIPVPSSSGTPLPSTDDIIVKSVFQQTLAKNWTPKKFDPPKGTIVVQGLVQVQGKKGIMVFDVQGCYDPKQSKYVFLRANMRIFKNVRQTAKGGP